MAREHRLAVLQQKIGKVIEAAGGGHAGVERTQRTGGGIARVGKSLEPFLFLFFVESIKGASLHDNFTAHFKLFRKRFIAHAQRQRANRACIAGNFFSNAAVAPSEGLV